VCQWTVDATTYKLYEGITVDVPITVGSWYIKNFYGFGYNGTATDPLVYVYIKVEQSIDDTNIVVANLILYNASASAEVAEVAVIDLTTKSVTGPIMLRPGNGLQLDLQINATRTGTPSATFKVGFYVSQKEEAPR
jgi:hypothetical protein